MENKIIEGIYTMMQKVFDKLDAISKSEKSSGLTKNHFDFLAKGQDLIVFNLKKLAGANQEKPERIIEKKNYQIILFGKDSPLNTKHFFWILGIVLFVCLALKIITPVMYEVSDLKEQNMNYKLFYEYQFLKEYEREGKVTNTAAIFQDIKNRDSSFVKDFNELRIEYERMNKSFSSAEKSK